MSKIWISQTNETHRHWVDTIITEASDKLNDWETKFVESIGLRVFSGASLTEAQEKTLERIYAEKTA